MNRFWQEYRAWIVGGLLGNLAAWFGLRWLGIDSGATLQSLLLLDTFIAVWWYAHLTRDLASSSANQTAINQQIFERSQRPCVVIEWQHLPPPPGVREAGWTYVARNVGQGLALNVVHVEDLDSPRLELLHIGALESGRSVELPRELVERLNREEREPLERKRHILIAEPVGESEWIVAENRIERGGRVSHRVRTSVLSDQQVEQIHRETASEYIHSNWPAIQRDLNRMLSELRQ